MATETVTLELSDVTPTGGPQAAGLAVSPKTSKIAQPLHIYEPAIEPYEPEYPTGAKFYAIVLSLCMVLVLWGMDETIVGTAVPAITDHFHTVADAATSSKMFIVGRAICGLGTSGMSSGCFTLMVLLFPLRRRPMYQGCFGIIEAAAVLMAPILGGVLTEKLSWRWCSWISLPLGVPTLLVMAFFLTNPRVEGGEGMTRKELISQLDLIGNVCFVPSITCLFVALGGAGVTYPWSDWRVIVPLVVFVVLLVAFIWQQYRKQDAATIPPRIIKQRNIIASIIFICCCNSSQTVIQYYIPTYFQAVRGFSPAKSGYMLLPFNISFSIGMLMIGSGTSIFGYFTPFMIFASIIMPVSTGLMTTWALDTPLVTLLVYSGFVGFASGVGFMGPQSAVQSTLPHSDIPLGIAIVLFPQHFGPALFLAAAQSIFTNQLVENLKGLPGLSADMIEHTGLTELKALVNGENLQEALRSFDKSLTQMWYLCVALACMTIVGSLLMEWRSVKQKKT
ncbi:hypothetical protein LTR86_005007 [Recurvomyces mirabilis]|nr:hypothetical protein LTR86_005007 [Recurvomyces mirabilis]